MKMRIVCAQNARECALFALDCFFDYQNEFLRKNFPKMITMSFDWQAQMATLTWWALFWLTLASIHPQMIIMPFDWPARMATLTWYKLFWLILTSIHPQIITMPLYWQAQMATLTWCAYFLQTNVSIRLALLTSLHFFCRSACDRRAMILVLIIINKSRFFDYI